MAFDPAALNRGYTNLGFYGNKTCLDNPGPGAYDPFPLLNPPGFRMSRPTCLPDRGPGHRCVKASTHPDVQINVRVQKSGAKNLGLRYRASNMRVEQVLDVGLIAEWNSGNPDQAVFPGDYIVTVNGKNVAKHGVNTLARELVSRNILEIGFAAGEAVPPLQWLPEPFSLSRPQWEQPLINYSAATFWDWPQAQQMKKSGTFNRSGPPGSRVSVTSSAAAPLKQAGAEAALRSSQRAQTSMQIPRSRSAPGTGIVLI